MSQQRRERLQELLVRELADVVRNRLRDPRRGWASITRVDLSADLRFARVYVSILGSEEEERQGLEVLERAKPFLRGEIGRRLRIRHVPELQFRRDRSMEASQRVMEILESLEIPPPEATPGEAGDAGRGDGAG